MDDTRLWQQQQQQRLHVNLLSTESNEDFILEEGFVFVFFFSLVIFYNSQQIQTKLTSNSSTQGCQKTYDPLSEKYTVMYTPLSAADRTNTMEIHI